MKQFIPKNKKTGYIFHTGNLLILWLLTLIVACNSSSSDNRAQVVAQLQGCAKLASVEYVLTKMIVADKEKKILGISLNDATFMARTQAFVKAGIDLNKLTPDDISVDGKKISIKLPAIEVVSFSYPVDSFKIIDKYCENGWFNKIKIAEKEQLYRTGESDIRKAIKALGITKTAENNMRELLTGLLKSLQFEEIYIQFKQSDDLMKSENDAVKSTAAKN